MKTKHIHRDIPLFVSFAGSVIILLLLVAACDNKDYSKASPFDNAVYIDVAKVKDVANFTFNNLKQTGQQELSAVLAYPAEQDIDVNFQVDPSLIGYLSPYRAHSQSCWLPCGHLPTPQHRSR